MRTFFKRALEVLQTAEPLFRLIEVILIVFGTVFVSCQANAIARHANAIAETQINISKDENQPNFIITQVLEANSQGSENANSVLYLYNTGTTFYNLDVDIACIIELNSIDTKRDGQNIREGGDKSNSGEVGIRQQREMGAEKRDPAPKPRQTDSIEQS